MLQDNVRLIPNIAKFLMLCRKEIGINTLHNKVRFDSPRFYAYISFLEEHDLITTIKLEGKGSRRKNVLITEKGKAFLQEWIKLNEMVGIKICPYL